MPHTGTPASTEPKRRRRRGGRGRRPSGGAGEPQAQTQAPRDGAQAQAPPNGAAPSGTHGDKPAGATARGAAATAPASVASPTAAAVVTAAATGAATATAAARAATAVAMVAPRVDTSFVARPEQVRPDGPTPDVDLPAFAELGLKGDLLAGVAAMGYETPTPIQEQAIPRVLAGRDVVGCAQTGTGKTAAFVVPILQRMNERAATHGEELPSSDGKTAHPRALVVTPTRELCAQIEEVGQTLSTYSGRRVLAVFGGVPYEPQAQKVRRGVDLLVATPGRLLDMLRQGHILLDRVDTLVLDEADRMLDMGFWPDVKRIIDAVPVERQNLFFSATMSKTVLSIIEDTLHKPVFIELGGSAQPVDEVGRASCP